MSELKDIKPGVNYPRCVTIVETIEGEEVKLEFLLTSYLVGTYCAIYQDGALVQQTGDHDNKTFARRLKADVKKAIGRGAAVEIGDLLPVQKGD